MCNLAGYVGTKAAAPILIDMLRKEEGFNGGYYTGIATIHEGKIYYAKLTGDVERLVAETDAAKLPGTIGIIHGRSDSGGGDEWAHPFVAVENEEPALAYIANGARGYFACRSDEQCKLAEQLLAEGYQMTRCEPTETTYQTLSDGSVVHMSDIMCQLIHRNIRGGAEAPEAMAKAFCDLPGEIVGLMLSMKNPNGITWSRINMPMFVGFADHGAYLATSATAFPEDAVTDPRLLPACSSGHVYQDRFVTIPFQNPPECVAEIDAMILHEAYEMICAELEQVPRKFKELVAMVKPIFGKTNCPPADAIVYEVLHALDRCGRLKIDHRRVPGARAGLDAPKFFMSL